MNRSELVRSVSRKVEQPQWMVDLVLDGIIEVTALALATEDQVSVRGFGKFVLRFRKAVTKINPKTGDEIKIPDRYTVAFLPSSGLRDRVNA